MAASVGIFDMSRMQDRKRICGSLQNQHECRALCMAVYPAYELQCMPQHGITRYQMHWRKKLKGRL